MALSFFDVRSPLAMTTHGIDAQADDLTVSCGEVRFEL